jgi:hypothetical protein
MYRLNCQKNLGLAIERRLSLLALHSLTGKMDPLFNSYTEKIKHAEKNKKRT